MSDSNVAESVLSAKTALSSRLTELSTHQLMSTAPPSQIPNLDRPSLIAADQLSLIRVYHRVVHGGLVVEVALGAVLGRARVPDLERPVLGGGADPLALVLPRDGGDVARVRVQRGNLPNPINNETQYQQCSCLW